MDSINYKNENWSVTPNDVLYLTKTMQDTGNKCTKVHILKNEVKGKIVEENIESNIFELTLPGGKKSFFCPACKQVENQKNIDKLRTDAITYRRKRETLLVLEKDSVFSDKTLKSASFAEYLEMDSETTAARNSCRIFAKRYLNNEIFNVILTGNSGVGKSHLSMSILNAVNNHANPWKSCLYVSLSRVFILLKDSWDNKESQYTEKYFLELLDSADILVIDDLGAETGASNSIRQASDFTHTVLTSILDGRQDKATIITSNLNIDKLSNMYDERVMDRIFSRAKGNVIEFREAKSYRLHHKESIKNEMGTNE